MVRCSSEAAATCARQPPTSSHAASGSTSRGRVAMGRSVTLVSPTVSRWTSNRGPGWAGTTTCTAAQWQHKHRARRKFTE